MPQKTCPRDGTLIFLEMPPKFEDHTTGESHRTTFVSPQETSGADNDLFVIYGGRWVQSVCREVGFRILSVPVICDVIF